MLCARHPDMMLQQERGGDTPLNYSCCSNMSVVQVLCEAGGREAVSAAVQHPTDPRYYLNGWLPLHNFVTSYADTLKKQPLSEAADAFRLLLRLYPEAAGIEGGVGDWKTTPYQLAVEHNVPAYYRRLLLQASPNLDPAELRRLNGAERRLAMFVAFAAVSKSRLLLARLRVANKDLVKHVVSFL